MSELYEKTHRKTLKHCNVKLHNVFQHVLVPQNHFTAPHTLQFHPSTWVMLQKCSFPDTISVSEISDNLAYYKRYWTTLLCFFNILVAAAFTFRRDGSRISFAISINKMRSQYSPLYFAQTIRLLGRL